MRASQCHVNSRTVALLFYRACLQYLRLLPDLVTRDLTSQVLASASHYIFVGLPMGLIFEIAPY